jgi:hypothetical protein
VDWLTKLVKSHPKGMRAEEIRKMLGLDVREMPRILKEGLPRRSSRRRGRSGRPPTSRCERRHGSRPLNIEPIGERGTTVTGTPAVLPFGLSVFRPPKAPCSCPATSGTRAPASRSSLPRVMVRARILDTFPAACAPSLSRW